MKSMADMQVVYNFPDNPTLSTGDNPHHTLRIGFAAARCHTNITHGPSSHNPPHLHGSAPAAPRGMLGQALEAHLASLKANQQTNTTPHNNNAAGGFAHGVFNPASRFATTDGVVAHNENRGTLASRLSKQSKDGVGVGDDERDVSLSKRMSVESRASEEVVDAAGTRVPRRSMDIIVYKGHPHKISLEDRSGQDLHLPSVTSRPGSLTAGGNSTPGLALPVCGSYTRGRAAWWRTVSGTSPQLPFAFTPAVQSGLSTAASVSSCCLLGPSSLLTGLFFRCVCVRYSPSYVMSLHVGISRDRPYASDGFIVTLSNVVYVHTGSAAAARWYPCNSVAIMDTITDTWYAWQPPIQQIYGPALPLSTPFQHW